MNKHVGSNFDEFLGEDGVLEEVTAVAIKRVICWQLAKAMKTQGINKRNSPNACTRVVRVLDGSDTGLTIETLSRAAQALGCRLKVELAAA